MQKKSGLDFFCYDLVEWDSTKPPKFLDFSTTCGGADYENFFPFKNKKAGKNLVS